MIFFISVPPSYSEATDPNEQSKLTQGGNQENHDKQAVGQYVDTQYQQPPVPQHEGYQFNRQQSLSIRATIFNHRQGLKIRATNIRPHRLALNFRAANINR